MELLTFESLRSLLEEYKDKRVMLTFHSIGDTDSVSSALALSRYMSSSSIATPDFITANCKRMLETLGFAGENIGVNFDQSADLIVMLDVNNFDECGSFKEKLSSFTKKILIIDHHAPKEISKNNVAAFNDESYNSATSIVYDILDSAGITLDKKTAMLIALGIISDSADFRNSFPKTFSQIGKLLEISGTDYPSLLENIHHVATPESREESIKGLFKAETMIKDNLLFVYGQASFHANHSAENALKIGADVSLFYTIKDNDVSFSSRLRSPLDKRLGIHLGLIMKNLAPIIKGTGGGHPCAAGVYGKVEDSNYKVLINEFIAEVSSKGSSKKVKP